MCGALRLNTLPPVLAHHACYDESSVYEHGVAKVERQAAAPSVSMKLMKHTLEGTLRAANSLHGEEGTKWRVADYKQFVLDS